MARLPPDCAICCEPLATDLAAPSTLAAAVPPPLVSSDSPPLRCRIRPCRTSEVIGLQFELAQPADGALGLHANSSSSSKSAFTELHLGIHSRSLKAMTYGYCRSVAQSLTVRRRQIAAGFAAALAAAAAAVAAGQAAAGWFAAAAASIVRLSMAHANIKALLEAEAARRRENLLLQGKLASLEGQLLSHVERTSKAEAVASECRNKLVQLQASRDRVSAELLQVKREAERQAALKKYSNEASSLTQAKAVEFLRGKVSLILPTEDIDEALRTQHGTICELQNENARLRSEKLAQRRHFKAEVERKNELIRRLRVTDEVLFPSGLPQQQPQAQQQVSSRLQSSRVLAREPKTRPPGEALRTPRVTSGSCNSSRLDSFSGAADGSSMAANSARNAKSLLERKQTVPAATEPTTPRRPLNLPAVLPQGVQTAPLKKKPSKSSAAEAPPQRGTVKSSAGPASLSLSNRQQTEKERGASRATQYSPQRLRWRWSGAAAAAIGCMLPLLFVPLYVWPPLELAA
ncbi:hypothetical protein Esti_005678 [Eimeria stiedai]